MRATLVASGALFILAVAYWLGADAIPKSSLGGAVGADGLPKLLAVILGALSLALAGQTLLEARRRRASGPDDTPGDAGAGPAWRTHAKALGVLAIGAGFVALLPIAGYTISAALLLMAIATYSGRKPGPGTLVFGILGAAFFEVLFVYVLQVPMPQGAWLRLFT